MSRLFVISMYCCEALLGKELFYISGISRTLNQFERISVKLSGISLKTQTKTKLILISFQNNSTHYVFILGGNDE